MGLDATWELTANIHQHLDSVLIHEESGIRVQRRVFCSFFAYTYYYYNLEGEPHRLIPSNELRLVL